jgi:hypothetical protein
MTSWFSTGDTLMGGAGSLTYNEYYARLRAQRTPHEVWLDSRRQYWSEILERLRRARRGRLEAVMAEAVGPEAWGWYASWANEEYF